MRASWQSLSECSVASAELAAEEDSCRKSHCQPEANSSVEVASLGSELCHVFNSLLLLFSDNLT